MLSCNQVHLEKIDINKAMENELEQFSTNEVDHFPSFKSCQVYEESEATKQCFVETIHLHTTNFFTKNTISEDSLGIYLYISNKGRLNVQHIESKSQKLDSLREPLNKYFKQNLPELYPAQKQGIPVNCKLLLPILVKSQISVPTENR